MSLFGSLMPLLDPFSHLAVGRGFGGGTVEDVLLVAIATVAAATLLAGLELTLRAVRERRHRDETDPVLTALLAQRLYARALYGIAPSVVASVLVFLRTDSTASAAFVFAAMALTAALLRARRPPLHLMPIARYAYNAGVPAAGIGVALLPGVFGASLLPPNTGVAALIAAIFITLINAWLENRFESARPIWVAVVGPPQFAHKLGAELEDTGIRGYQVIGYIGEEPEAGRPGVRWLGYLDDVRSAVKRERVDLLVVAPQNPRLPVFEQVARDCLDLPVRMIEATALYEDLLGHVPIGTINSAWFQFIMHPRYSPASPLSKRTLDLCVSGLMLVAAAPIMLLCAIAIKLEDRGTIFYRQRRVGEEGREFDMVKFRMLRPDADDLWATHTEEDLLTRTGRLMRKTHVN